MVHNWLFILHVLLDVQSLIHLQRGNTLIVAAYLMKLKVAFVELSAAFVNQNAADYLPSWCFLHLFAFLHLPSSLH